MEIGQEVPKLPILPSKERFKLAKKEKFTSEEAHLVVKFMEEAVTNDFNIVSMCTTICLVFLLRLRKYMQGLKIQSIVQK